MPIHSHPTPAALERILSTFLAAAQAPGRADEVLDALAADAPLCLAGAVRERRELTRAAFSALWRDGRETPRPRFEQVEAIAVEPGGADRTVAWFMAIASEDERPVQVAAGFTLEGDAWKISWLTLARRREGWTFRQGRLETLANFAEGTPASWLHVAYQRLYGFATPPLQLLPGARFGCGASGSCCRVGFAVDVPAGAQALLAALELPALPVRPDGRLQLKDAGERCRFLVEDRCAVHQAVGRQPFPACARYPFVFAPTPEGVAVAMAGSCGNARANFGPALAERHDELHALLGLAELGPLPPKLYLARGQEATPEGFFAAEATLQQLLAREDLPLSRRLWLGERVLHALLQGQAPDLAAFEQEPDPRASEAERQSLLGFLRVFDAQLGFERPTAAQPGTRPQGMGPPGSGSPGGGSPGTGPLGTGPLGTGPLGAPAPRPIELAPGQTAALARLMQNQLHAKTLSYPFDLLMAHHANLFVLAWAAHAEGLTDELLGRLGALVMHGELAAALSGSDPRYKPFQRLMRAPTFGPWVVACLTC